MNRSQLREVIKSIVRRKLNEASSNTGSELATFIGNTLHQGNTIRKIVIQSHQGNTPLEIAEWWMQGEDLHIGVVPENQPNLQEFATAVTSTGSPVNPSVDDKEDQTDQMTDVEKKQIQNAQKEQEKLTNDIRRVDGTKQKLLEPMRRKIQTLDSTKASKEKKLGSVTSKITNIQRKYSKV